MVILEWDIILADCYTIGLLYDYDLRVSDKKNNWASFRMGDI